MGIFRTEDLPLVLTVKQVQEVLRIAKPNAYNLAHQKDFPSIRVGRAIRVPRDAFLRWLEKQGEA